MNFNFTDAVAEAIQSAFRLAEEGRCTEVHESHLLLGFLEQENGFFQTMFQTLKMPCNSLINETKKFITTLPTYSGEAQKPQPGRSFQNRIQEADSLAKKQNDSYISTNHFFIVFWKNGGEPL